MKSDKDRDRFGINEQNGEKGGPVWGFLVFLFRVPAKNSISLVSLLNPPTKGVPFVSKDEPAPTTYCGWTKFCTALKPWLKPVVLGNYRGIESFQ